MASDDKKRKLKNDKKEKKEHKKHKSSSIIVDTKRRRSSVQTAALLDSSSSFSEVVIKLYIHLAPMWSNKPMDGVNEILNAFLMKNVPEVDGIVLAHSDVELMSEKGKVLYDSPFCHFFITAKLLVWKPKKGSKLVGRINLQSQDHIGLLIYGTFNASIPKSRISSEKYEWRASEEEDQDDDENDNDEENDDRTRNQHGEWVIKASGDSIGGDNGSLEFSVVDIIEANDILTVTGAL